MIDDRTREVGAVLSYILGRQLRTGEIVNALGVSRSTYYLARDEGRLTTADNLIRLATAFGINPVDMLLRYGLVSRESVVECAAEINGEDVRSEQIVKAAKAKAKKLAPRLQLRPDAPPL